MRKIRNILSQKETALFIFLAYVILFNWPFLTIADKWNPAFVFMYLFLLWAIGIGILFFMALSYGQKHGSAEGDINKKENNK